MTDYKMLIDYKIMIDYIMMTDYKLMIDDILKINCGRIEDRRKNVEVPRNSQQLSQQVYDLIKPSN